MDDCLFCKIVKGEIPSFQVYEDTEYLAFMDIFPRVKGHILLIPKKHYRWVYDVPAMGAYFDIARKVGQAAKETLGARFFSMITMGEAVHHAHIHILPQMSSDIQGIQFTDVISMEKAEIQMLAEKVKSSW
jgi:histidine triad (HIT) family protein